MDMYLENHIYSEYRAANLDDLFSFSLLHKRASAMDTLQNITRKPLRGLGRYMPGLKAADDSCVEAVRLQQEGPLKGLGRRSDFYPGLIQSFFKTKPKTDASLKTNNTYWRGLRISKV